MATDDLRARQEAVVRERAYFDSGDILRQPGLS
jgi:hypothetical protein